MNPYDALLPFVRRPSRYLGCELNVIRKEPHEVMEVCYGLEGEAIGALHIEKVAVTWRTGEERS